MEEYTLMRSLNMHSFENLSFFFIFLNFLLNEPFPVVQDLSKVLSDILVVIYAISQ